jgi:hypothetical protein
MLKPEPGGVMADEMSDDEIRRRCAEKMEARPELPGSSDIWAYSVKWAGGIEEKTIWLRGWDRP